MTYGIMCTCEHAKINHKTYDRTYVDAGTSCMMPDCDCKEFDARLRNCKVPGCDVLEPHNHGPGIEKPDMVNHPSGNDLSVLFSKEEEVRRWQAERENASARLDLAQIRKNCAHLISQHEPVASLGIDREMLRLALQYVQHGDEKRLIRDLEATFT